MHPIRYIIKRKKEVNNPKRVDNPIDIMYDRKWEGVTDPPRKEDISVEKLTIKAIRINLGLQQEEMANKLGWSLKQYRERENGNVSISFREMELFSRVTGVKMEHIKDPQS